ncbi:potassium channel family protein [Pseudalkalibacillus caeni]|uniref:Potassium channel protein n=1 Tax=Exobacillus caeni TaxID=2574798 RepID=A0A5R9F3Y2_9BACL|nr:potassium channel family protein [Pseudalkalibacillus caeni]TLS37046.1 potassium channel protein [Pseudalkalibacillus caeni]
MFEIIKKVVKVNTLKLVIYTFIFYIVCAFIIYFLEPENFRNPFIAFWWVLTTVTTTGFGDYAPVTVPGMLFAMFLYLSGIGLIGIIIGKIVDSISFYRRLKMEGKLSYKGKNHFVIIGWSYKAQKTVEEILITEHIDTDIVLVDQLKESPFEHDRFHYICGNPTSTSTFEQANLSMANSVSIFAPKSEDETFADGKTLLITSAIEKYAAEINKAIYTIVEIVHQDHIDMFKHARVDEFVLSNEAFPHLIAKTMLHNGSSQLFMQLLSNKYGDNLWEINPAPEWKTYRDAFEALSKQGANLIADGSDFSIIRRMDDNIPDNADLYIICDQETFQQIRLT